MHSQKILRALIVSPTPTWPLNFGNRKRIFSVCKRLKSLGFEVHFIHYASEQDWRGHLPLETRRKMDNQWDIVDHLWPSRPLHEFPKDNEDHFIDEWWDQSLENHLKNTFEAREYDLAVVNYTWLSKALEFVPKKTLKVLDTHDKFSDRRKLLSQNGISSEFFHTTEAQELIALNRADVVWAIKDEEKKDFIEMGTSSIVETLIHVDESRESSSPGCTDEMIFGFIGANNNVNRVNLERFIKESTPIFYNYLAPLKVKIAGSICKELNLEDNPFFEAIGYVDDINDFYDGIDAAIIPMEFSTGLKIKAAEALSQSKPLLSLEHAMEGFSQQHMLHSIPDFNELALAMTDLSYESNELLNLKLASIQSYNEAIDSINSTIKAVKKKVIDSKKIIVVLHEDYGNPKKVGHYISKSRIDFIGWNFTSPLFIKFSKNHEDSKKDCFTRYIENDSFDSLLMETQPSVLLNLSEYLPPFKHKESISVFSNCRIPFLDDKDYIKYDSIDIGICENYFPSIGHVDLDMQNMKSRSNEYWVLGSSLDDQIKLFVMAYGFSNLKGRLLKLQSLGDLDDVLTECDGLPSIVFVAKELDLLSYTEQLLVEICYKLEVDVINLSNFQLLKFNRNVNSYDYENTFYPLWEKFLLKMS